MKVATWNVNGIRARQAQVHEWIATRAPGRRLPAGDQGHARPGSGAALRVGRLLVLLARRQGLLRRRAARAPRSLRAERPRSRIPHFDHRDPDRHVADRRRPDVVASVYVPNGGKDFPAKMRFLEALDEWARRRSQASGRQLVLCGDLNVARTDRDVHPKERKPGAIGQLPEERALLERILGRGLVDVGRALDPDNDGAVHLVGAVAQPARSATSAGGSTTSSRARPWRARPGRRRPARRRHERPRAGDGDLRSPVQSGQSRSPPIKGGCLRAQSPPGRASRRGGGSRRLCDRPRAAAGRPHGAGRERPPAAGPARGGQDVVDRRAHALLPRRGREHRRHPGLEDRMGQGLRHGRRRGQTGRHGGHALPGGLDQQAGRRDGRARARRGRQADARRATSTGS